MKFITVPQVTLPNGHIEPSFRVGQFVCCKGEDGKAAITEEGTPWSRISYFEAKEACRAIGGEMITELQWLAIAHDAATQDCNWTGGKVGEGDLFQGLRNETVSCPHPGKFIPDDETEQRWLTLSNGERICDLNGNIYQWVHDNVQGDENGITGKIAGNSISLTTAPFPSQEKGIGWYPEGGCNWSGVALLRGGCWGSLSVAGVFYLSDDLPDRRFGDVGFRCTKSL